MPAQGCTLPYLSACIRVHFTLPKCLYKGALYLTSVPVQGCTLPLPYLSACTRVHFTLLQCLYKGALYLTSVPVQWCTLPYLSACTRVHFTLTQCLYKGALYLYLTSVPLQGCTLPYLSACTRVHFSFTWIFTLCSCMHVKSSSVSWLCIILYGRTARYIILQSLRLSVCTHESPRNYWKFFQDS